MEKMLLKNALIYRDHAFAPGDVLCSHGRIEAVGPRLEAEGTQTVDCHGLRLVPGFIDAHTHGAAGVDVNAADEAGLEKIAAFFASQGTTAWNASVLTDTEETTLRCLSCICAVQKRRGYGAQLLGAHLEGPFLAPEYKGAMPEHLLKKGSAALLRRYQEAFEGVVRYLTVSPEVEGVPEMIAQVKDEVPVAIGHSGADYATAMEAIRLGARCATHTFNAMRLFHQHEPAIMGAVMESDVWCEAICDGRHLHPASVRLLLKCKGWDRVMAVTDSIMAAGLPDGNYRLGVNDVIVKDGDAKLADTGTRAGSTLTMIQALRNLIRFTGHPLEDVLPLLSENPAAALRLDDRKGRIQSGLDADLVLLGEKLEVAMTIVGGQTVYCASKE